MKPWRPLWLDQLKSKGKADATAQSVLTALADTHHKTPRLCLKLIGPFLDLRRVDFSAKRLYRSFLDLPELMPSENGGLRDKYVARIQDLMGTEENGDTPIIAEGSPRGAIADKVPAGGTLGDRLAGSESSGVDISIESGGRRSREYLSRMGGLPARGMRILVPAAKGGATAGVSFITLMLSGCAGLMKKIGTGLRDLLRHLIRDRERTGKYIKTLLMGALGVWLVFFCLEYPVPYAGYRHTGAAVNQD